MARDMKRVLLATFFLVSVTFVARAAAGCCQTNTVRNAPADMAELNGVYVLKEEGAKRAEICIDGCVYLKDSEEFCFIENSLMEDSETVCEVPSTLSSSLGTFFGSTSTLSSPLPSTSLATTVASKASILSEASELKTKVTDQISSLDGILADLPSTDPIVQELLDVKTALNELLPSLSNVISASETRLMKRDLMSDCNWMTNVLENYESILITVSDLLSKIDGIGKTGYSSIDLYLSNLKSFYTDSKQNIENDKSSLEKKQQTNCSTTYQKSSQGSTEPGTTAAGATTVTAKKQETTVSETTAGAVTANATRINTESATTTAKTDTTVQGTTTADTTVQETTAAGTTVPKTTAAITTVQETTATGTTVQKTTAKSTYVQETTTVGTTVLETTAKGTAAQETTAAGTSAKETTAAGTTVQETTAEGTTVQETTAAATSVQGTTATGTTVQETTAAGTTVQGTATVAGTTVQGTTAAGTTVQETTLEGTTVQGTATADTTVQGTSASATSTKGTTAAGTTGQETTAAVTTVQGTTESGTTDQGTTAAGTTVPGTSTSGTTVQGTSTSGTTAQGTTTDLDCESGWTKTGDKCYKAFTDTKDYWAAQAACKGLGAGTYLAAPKTSEIMGTLEKLRNDLADTEAEVWLGLDDCGSSSIPCADGSEGTFTFSDGSVLTVKSGTFAGGDVVFNEYTDWKTGQPVADEAKRQKQDCVKLDKTLSYDDASCDKAKNYVCEKPLTSSTSVTGQTTVTGSGAEGTTEPATNTEGSTTTAQLTTTVQATTTAYGCESGWTKSSNKCYKIVLDTKDYWAAKAACIALGTDTRLAAPKTTEIMSTLEELWNGLTDTEAEVWLGLDDCGSSSNPCSDSSEGTFTFSDGSVLTVKSGTFAGGDVVFNEYTDWKTGQPVADEAKRQKQDCVKLDKTLSYDDASCDKPKNYVCEKPTTA